ncbi:MAG: hypothetical protein AAFN10_18090 [Bacteroidota bacterium]
MKTKWFFSTALLALMMCFSIQTFAQSGKALVDTMMVFNEPLKFTTGQNLIGAGIGLQFKAGSGLKSISAPLAKKLVLPRAVRTSKTPIVLRHNGNCFMFSCDPVCESCQLVWWDRNGDGEVQPRRELRCVNAKGKAGKISVKKVPCK